MPQVTGQQAISVIDARYGRTLQRHVASPSGAELEAVGGGCAADVGVDSVLCTGDDSHFVDGEPGPVHAVRMDEFEVVEGQRAACDDGERRAASGVGLRSRSWSRRWWKVQWGARRPRLQSFSTTSSPSLSLFGGSITIESI
jgi:hypothetical protein